MAIRSPLSVEVPADEADRVPVGELARLMESRAVRSVFQPIVDLESGEPIGFEALARGPDGSALANPTTFFREAYRAGRVNELDWICRAAAFRAADAANIPRTMPLFINVEPISLGTTCPDDLREDIETGMRERRVLIEVTERSLASDTGALLAAVEHARESGIAVALDDVGAEPASLAMMPLVRPDVIKLDLSLVHGWPTIRRARIVNAVQAEAERTGALILAEGIETPQHAKTARSMGATLGQGWHFAYPEALPPVQEPRTPLFLRPARSMASGTPFDIISRHRWPRRMPKSLMLPMSRHLEYVGLDSSEPAVFLACFQDTRHFRGASRSRFLKLAERAGLCAVLGAGMPAQPGPGLRGGRLADGDPLRDEWIIVVLGPEVAAALAARDCGDDGPDLDRRFDVSITHDRALVVEAALPILKRLEPLPR